jgi:glycosyltransferase involved in cell wall biosynthesis
MQSSKKHIVFIAAWFHPINKVASFRINAFAHYLDKENYDISVIAYNDENLLAEELTAARVHVYREKSKNLLRVRRQLATDSKWKHHLKSLNNKIALRFTKEDYPGWSTQVLNRLKHIHASFPIDLIVSTYAPLDCHVAAYHFKKMYPQTKWIADMRDEMSQNNFISPKLKSKLIFWEKKFNENVDAIVSVSKPILDGFKIHFNRECIIFQEIKNGFDHEIFHERVFGDCFKMLYAGTFYGKRKPDTLFAALLDLQRNNQSTDKWELILLGTHLNFDIPESLKKNISLLPNVSNLEAIEMMFEADCNVLIHPATGVKGVYTGKLFDYLSVERPILALVDPNDVAAQLIRDLEAGEVVDFYAIDEIKSALINLISNWSNKIPFHSKREEIQKLHRKNQSKELEELIQKLLHG